MADSTVLLVDPDGAARAALESVLDAEDVDVLARDSRRTAEAALENRSVDCLVTEYDLGDGTGLDLVEIVRETVPDAGCVLYTDADRETVRSESSELIAAFVPKSSPAAETRVAELVETTLECRSQASYPLPEREDERLGALDRYDLEAPALQRPLERITDLAARYFDVPQSSLNVVAEHTQEFPVCHRGEWSPIAREESICTYTILTDGVTVIEDIGDDPRFAENEVVADLGIQSYAGVSITVDDGLDVATLCVYGREPRTFDEDDREYLSLLAEAAADWIELAGTRGEPATAEEVRSR